MWVHSFFLYFFFQAEDGIRDISVGLEFSRVLFRSASKAQFHHGPSGLRACETESRNQEWRPSVLQAQAAITQRPAYWSKMTLGLRMMASFTTFENQSENSQRR